MRAGERPCAIIAAILRYGRPLNLNARVDLDRWVVLSVFDGGLPGGVPPLNGTEIDPGHVKPRAGARASAHTFRRSPHANVDLIAPLHPDMSTCGQERFVLRWKFCDHECVR